MAERIRGIIFLIGLIINLSGQAQHVIKGTGNASLHDFASQQSFDLAGTWEFYWNQLLGPNDFKVVQHPAFIKVPGSWHRQSYPTIGHATYRATLTLPESQHGLAIYFPIINTAAKIWVNGELVAETGVVSTNQNSYKPKLSGTLIPLPEKTKKVELIIQVANYTYFSSGIGSPQLDKTAAIFSRMNRTNGIENFFAGSLIAMFVYQLILYFLYQRGKPHLWLSLICLGVALRALIVHGGSFLLPNLFPFVEWEIWKKIEFGSVYAIVALFPLYVYHLFIEHAPKKPLIVFIGIASGLCLVVLITPQYFYGKLLDVSHLGLLLAFVYAVYSIGKAWKAGNEDAKIILFGVLATFPFILIEILKNTMALGLNIEFMYLVEMGVLVFLIFQVYLLANHYAKAYHKLEVLNVNLEKVVEERTHQLVTANTVKDRLLSVMSHDIKSPLNSLRGVLQIFSMGAVSQEEFITLTRQIESDLNKTSLLVENILFWTAAQLKGVHVKNEKFDVHKLVEENIQLFRTIADLKKITLSHNTPLKLEINSDQHILNLVLRNLIANAIKFSFEGGMIDVRISKTDKYLTLQVKDSGIGMDTQTLQNLLSSQPAESTSGTGNEKGTGLGLSLCRDYLQKVGGQLTIESTVGKGSLFIIQLPLNK
jgi:signal transduction histidine kinase